MTSTRQHNRKYTPVWPVGLLLISTLAIWTAFGFAFVRALEMAAW